MSSLKNRLQRLEALLKDRLKAKDDAKLTMEEGSFEWAYLQGYIQEGRISQEEADNIIKECNESKNPFIALLGYPTLIKLDWEDWKQEDEGVIS